jgi:predicted HicB family RNase H-like nuclease
VENPTAEEKKMRFPIDIPESLHRRMKAQCALRGVKMNKIIQELLKRAFPA